MVRACLWFSAPLKYFHNTAVAVAQGLSNEVGLIALGYSSALDAYWTCANKSKQLPTWLCTKTRQHYEKLQRAAEQHEPPREFPAPADEWMVTGFTTAVAEAKAAAAAAQRKQAREAAKKSTTSPDLTPEVLPKLIMYDEHDRPTNAQDSVAVAEAGDEPDIHLDWKAWHRSELAQALDEEHAERSAVAVAMRAAFTCPQTRGAPVAVWLCKSNKRVAATEDVEPNAITSPALVGKNQRLATSSTHPFRQVVAVRHVVDEIATRKREKTSQPLPENPPAKDYYIVPEFQAPEMDDASEDESSFRYTGKESMLPFWAVDSVSGTKELAQLRDKYPDAEWPTKPNVDVTRIEFNVVTVGAIATERASLSYKVSIPALTNTRAIEKGGRLVRQREMRKSEPKEKTGVTWGKQVYLNKNKAEANAKAPPPKKRKTDICEYEDI